jgi:hypothetical protein
MNDRGFEKSSLLISHNLLLHMKFKTYSKKRHKQPFEVSRCITFQVTLQGALIYWNIRNCLSRVHQFQLSIPYFCILPFDPDMENNPYVIYSFTRASVSHANNPYIPDWKWYKIQFQDVLNKHFSLKWWQLITKATGDRSTYWKT